MQYLYNCRWFHGGRRRGGRDGGFSIVLCDLKTLLESGASANLVRDKARLIAADGW